MKFPLRHIGYKHWAWAKVNDVGFYVSEVKLRRIRIDKLVGTQSSVSLLGVKHVSSYGRPILAVRVGGVMYIRDGHHRVTRAVQRGQKTILAYVSPSIRPHFSADRVARKSLTSAWGVLGWIQFLIGI